MRKSPRLSVVLPAYNEEAILEQTARSILGSLRELEMGVELIIVDDGSTDRTGPIADELAQGQENVMVVHQQNQGFGGAVRSGVACATGEFVMFWPADLPTNADDLRPFVKNLGAADVLVGCRERRVGYSVLMRLNAWLYHRMVAWLFDLHVRDVNWIHVYRSRLFEKVRLEQTGIPMLVEALVRMRDAGASFMEIPVQMKPRASGVASASRVRVMWHTLVSFFHFWRKWKSEKAGHA